MARRLRKHYGAMPTEAVYRDACGSVMARHLRKRYDASSTVALWLVVCGGATA